MSDRRKLSDLLPSADGWVGIVIPLPVFQTLSPGALERIFGDLPVVEINLTGTYDDCESDS